MSAATRNHLLAASITGWRGSPDDASETCLRLAAIFVAAAPHPSTFFALSFVIAKKCSSPGSISTAPIDDLGAGNAPISQHSRALLMMVVDRRGRARLESPLNTVRELLIVEVVIKPELQRTL